MQVEAMNNPYNQSELDNNLNSAGESKLSTSESSFKQLLQDLSHEKEDYQRITQNPLFIGLQETIGYQFKDPRLLILALRDSKTDIGHTPSCRGYERLEFFGDAVLELIIRESLWNEFPHLNDKDRFETCSYFTKNETLALISEQLFLPQISQKLKLAGFSDHFSLNHHDKADFVESLIAALYRDGGMSASKEFVRRYWRSDKAPQEINGKFNQITLQVKSQNLRGYYFSNPLLKHLYYTNVEKNNSLEFLGDSVLRFIFRDLLYKRFPENTEAELTKKYDILISKKVINEICNSFNLNLNDQTFKAFISLFYLERGIENVSDYVLWHWTSKIARSTIIASLKKNKSSETSALIILTPNFKDLPPARNLLQDLLLMVNEYPSYNTSKSGEHHKPVFATILESNAIGKHEANGNSKKESERQAALVALGNLSAKSLAGLLVSHEEYLKKPVSHEFHLKILESRLIFLGFQNFTYHVLAQSPYEGSRIYRIEIQGKNITPTCGEGITHEIAKIIALSKTLRKLLRAEHQKIEKAIESKSFLEDTENHSFYLQVCNELLSAKGLKPSYAAFAKEEKKNLPLLTFQVTCNSTNPVEGYGYTALQAKINAAMRLLEKNSPELKLKRREKQSENNKEVRNLMQGLGRGSINTPPSTKNAAFSSPSSVKGPKNTKTKPPKPNKDKRKKWGNVVSAVLNPQENQTQGASESKEGIRKQYIANLK